jgi:membrane protein
LILAGPILARGHAQWAGLGSAFVWTWTIVQWPLVFALICIAVGLVYYIAPDAEQEWVWVTPGAVVAATLWVIASLLFRLYVVAFGNYQQTYGALGGVIMLLLWFYLSGLALVIGAEVNAEIEHASPWGKDPGEKVPGVRKKLGAAAARAFRERPAAASMAPAAVLQPRRESAPPSAPSAVSIGDWVMAMVLRRIWPRLRQRD